MLAEIDRAAGTGGPGLVGVGDVQRARGRGLIAGARVPSGSVIAVVAVVATLLVVWLPSTVFVPAITVWMLVTGMTLVPVVRTPAL